MYDDYDLDYIISTDYNLDENTQYVLDEDMWYEHHSYSHENDRDSHDDDDYRDQQDYSDLAYRHYA